MTGLHGIHVIVGMGLIFWVLLRSCSKHVRPWFAPVVPAIVAAYLVYIGILNHYDAEIARRFFISAGVFGVLALVVVGIVATLLTAHRRPVTAGDFSPEYFTPVDLVGLYWHLVDLIWIFLFPLLYLIH
jgi:heme/copper-type cytochrome/quinol oxidase subunit 3